MKQALLEQINRLVIQITYLRKQLILKKCADFKGIDFTPEDEIPDDVACAQAVTTLLKQCGAVDRVIPGTYTLWDYLARSRNWVPVRFPEPSDIAIAPTSTGNGTMRGHVWIVDRLGWWSNDSYTGKWMMNYTMTSAVERYTKKGGIKIYYFRYISAL